MIVVRDDLWLCVDCLMVAVNGDASGIGDEHQEKRTNVGLDRLGPNLVPNFDSENDDDGIREFSACGCDCCGSRLAGTMHRFAVLGNDAVST